jgi:hypothetical protein
VLGIAGVGCYALLRGWLRAKQADLPEMQKVRRCHCAVTAQLRTHMIDDLWVQRATMCKEPSTESATLMHKWHVRL